VKLVSYLFAESGTNPKNNDLNRNIPDRQARTGGLIGTALRGVVWLSAHAVAQTGVSLHERTNHCVHEYVVARTTT
jgi:hypothetical protein